MAEPDKKPVTLEELLVFSLAQTDALAKLLIEKGLITREEFREERATYQWIGNVNIKRLPFPTSLSTQILPPCSSTNFLAKVKPSPVPSTLCA
jgi:hypothetical protein